LDYARVLFISFSDVSKVSTPPGKNKGGKRKNFEKGGKRGPRENVKTKFVLTVSAA